MVSIIPLSLEMLHSHQSENVSASIFARALMASHRSLNRTEPDRGRRIALSVGRSVAAMQCGEVANTPDASGSSDGSRAASWYGDYLLIQEILLKSLTSSIHATDGLVKIAVPVRGRSAIYGRQG